MPRRNQLFVSKTCSSLRPLVAAAAATIGGWPEALKTAVLRRRLGWPARRALWELRDRGVLHVAPEPADWGRLAERMATYRLPNGDAPSVLP